MMEKLKESSPRTAEIARRNYWGEGKFSNIRARSLASLENTRRFGMTPVEDYAHSMRSPLKASFRRLTLSPVSRGIWREA
jgi:hypothetical protein